MTSVSLPAPSPALNRINPRKLLDSKWTARMPLERQKHFVVVKVTFDEDGLVVEECVIEAVLTRRRHAIDWRELRDPARWAFGWQ